MSEADFEREANKLLRDLGLPSDTLNFFESDSAKTSNWKSTLKAPSPPKARRVSSTGTTTQFQRRQRERAATATANGAPSSVIKRPDRSSIPFRNPPLSQGETTSGTNANRASASAKNRFSTPSGPSSIPVSSSSNVRTKSQSPPPQGLPDQPPASSGAPQASSTPTKRQVHRPAPRAPPSGYQSAKSRRASTPSRTTRSVSPTGGPAQKSSAATSTTSQSLSQGSGIPVFNRRLSPSAAAPSSQPTAPSTISSSTNPGGTANSNKPSHSVQKPATKTTVSSTSANRPAPQVVSAAAVNTSINTKSSTPSINGSAAVNGDIHAYESIDGNLVSRSRKKSASPPVKQSMLKKPSSNLNPVKYSEVNRRLSVPEKSHDGRTPKSQKATDDKGGSKADHKQLLQLLSVSTKSSTAQNSKQTPKPTTDTKAAAASTSTSSTSTGSKPVRPERTSVLSYSRIPISSSTSSSSSKTVPPTSQSSSEAKSASAAAASSSSSTTTTTGAGGSSKIPQPQSGGGGGGGFARGGGTWASSSTKTRQQHQQQKQLKQEQQPKVQEKPQEKPLGEAGGGNSRSIMTYDSLSPSDLDAILKQDDSFLLKENDRPTQKADANVSGVYDRLTPKEIMMILKDEDVSKDKDRGEKPAELKQNGAVAVASSTDPMEHLYARVIKRRRHSDGQGAPENRQSLTSPISDPGTADQTTKKGKRHSADETGRSDSRGSSNPPSRSSSRELRSSEKLLNGSVQQQNGRSVSSSGSTATGTTATVSSPESLTDRQTPDSDERRSRISVSWPKQSLDATNTNAMSAVATTTVQALQTLVEVMTPQPSPLKSDGKKFNYEDESSGTTPWYLLDTEENESTGSSHPLSPDLPSELLSTTTTTTTSPLSLQQAGTIVNEEAKIVGKTAGRRYSDTASKPQVEPVAHTQQSSSSSKGSASGASNRVSERRRSSGQMNDSSRKSSSASNPPCADSPSSRKTSTSDRASQSSHGNHGNHLTVKDQPNWPGQKRKISPDPPPPISRTLSSPEHDYAILDPEFNEEFFGYCARCSKPVIGVETGCLALDQVYHLGCFTCSKCHASLSGQNFYMLEDTIVCEADFLRTLERCHACKQRIRDRVLRACGQCYHPSCFRCVVCGQCLDGVPYIVSNSLKVYCIHDYHKKHAPKCAVCGESIIPRSGRTKSLRVTASGRSYHVDCYKCEDCGRQLASKGGDEKCYPLEGHLYCRECNAARVYQWYKLSSDYQQEPGLIV